MVSAFIDHPTTTKALPIAMEVAIADYSYEWTVIVVKQDFKPGAIKYRNPPTPKYLLFGCKQIPS
jgi:hypothetical protein